MPTKRNTKNYALVEVIQPKNYMTLVKDKLCDSVEEIILSYVFEDSKRQTHACKLNLNYHIARLNKRFMHMQLWAYGELCNIPEFHHKVTNLEVFYASWCPFMWKNGTCEVCKKEFLNLKVKTTEYQADDETQADYTDEWEWCGDVCEKCDARYNIGRLHKCDEAIFTDFMWRLCEGDTEAERDEIFYEYEDFDAVEWD